MKMAGVVIIGSGQAGVSTAARLRAEGFDDPITMIGDEPAPPYQRPPLSKAYLMGQMDRERLYLHPDAFYSENEITLRLGQPVTAIDPAGKSINIGGDRTQYDTLVLASGAAPRRLPASIGGDLDGVFTVRSLADVDAMVSAFQAGARVLIVGGGYIGLEAAAVASKLGLKVTLVEAADRILQRVAAPKTSAWFRDLHSGHGVEILEGAGLERLVGTDRVTRAVLANGRAIDVDFVIVGIGVTPNTDLAWQAGLALEIGIRVDEMGRTSDPSIWAAGDCTSLPYRGGRVRLESVQNAIDQAAAVAANIAGANEAYDPKPWFWSDQYDVKLQIAGLNIGSDRVAVRAGERDHSVSHWYYRGGELLAVDAMNDPRAYMVGKRLIEARKTVAAEQVTDTGIDLKTLLR